MAFCAKHCKVVGSLGYKLGLRDFIKSCSDYDVNVDPSNYCKKMKSQVNTLLNTICISLASVLALIYMNYTGSPRHLLSTTKKSTMSLSEQGKISVTHFGPMIAHKNVRFSH